MAVQPEIFPDLESAEFVVSDEVAEVARTVIARHRGAIGRIEAIAEQLDAGACVITYVLNEKPFDPDVEEEEPEIAGRCVKAPALWRDLIGWTFVVWARGYFWRQYDQALREALLLHELLHIEVKLDKNGEPKFSVRKHDVEDFVDVALQYGPNALAGDGARYVRAAALFAGEPEPAIGRRKAPG